jgi:hypothetical protein
MQNHLNLETLACHTTRGIYKEVSDLLRDESLSFAEIVQNEPILSIKLFNPVILE